MDTDARPHVVWDWNGTLLDDAALIADAMNAAYRTAGLAAVSHDRYRAAFSLSATELIQRTHGVVPGQDTMKRMGAAYHEHYRSRRCALAADAREALALAEERGATQSLLSLHPEDALVKALAEHGLAGRFALVTGRTGDAAGGKHRRLLDHMGLLAQAGVTAGRIVLVGDTGDDGDAARRAGVRAVLHTGGVQDRTALARTGWPVVDSLLEAVRMATTDVSSRTRTPPPISTSGAQTRTV
ncbi:HAD family hydrolase [Streptomyces sp. NK08204]|uniref:HAD family hydrolase n=1 Tax=Streptomyces sp. NK08204 TaxID=2873260 RepID=UPI001CEDD8BF|nr:HAD hydrolase-like protein [Streptomyces sp. NK08204]